jgi:hypothetical protein
MSNRVVTKLIAVELPSYTGALKAYEVSVDGQVVGVVYSFREETALHTTGVRYSYGKSVCTRWTWAAANGQRNDVNRFRLTTRTRKDAIERLIKETSA